MNASPTYFGSARSEMLVRTCLPISPMSEPSRARTMDDWGGCTICQACSVLCAASAGASGVASGAVHGATTSSAHARMCAWLRTGVVRVDEEMLITLSSAPWAGAARRYRLSFPAAGAADCCASTSERYCEYSRRRFMFRLRSPPHFMPLPDDDEREAPLLPRCGGANLNACHHSFRSPRCSSRRARV